ncbi:hypothetical protein SAMN05444166_7043 [Singulisphaera sp. GP187]|uniref:right-handed parallel beta-helix repeat-containing protein n=1 Tax=Singulisphaera sp. GP187 TaxID=1882752 RepID=UPI00092A5B3D|nr:right-handed parallel beta-helix repeat-containing protein [Singulisphaera sp. GP187]SIO62425.1 hypothetical protein SAMN05444166_7043 [Singulisphaera sp. GP187]
MPPTNLTPTMRRNRAKIRTLAWSRPLERLEGRVVPATILVTSLADAGPGTLRAAITQANIDSAADTVTFDSTVRGTITLARLLPTLSSDIEIEGPGPSALTIAGQSTPGFQIFNVEPGVVATISGLTITRGSAPYGGGIFNGGTLSVVNATINGNQGAEGGGGIANSGTMTIVNSTISGNETNLFDGGGGIFNGGTMTIVGSTVSGNVASTLGVDRGGGISNLGTMSVINSTVSGNHVVGSGGGFFNAGNLSVVSSTISGNRADAFRGSQGVGGGIANSGTLTMVGSIISGNTTSSGSQDISGGGSSLGQNLFFDAPAISLDPTDLPHTDALLGPLADNGGPTQTQALLPGSPAIDASVTITGVASDQRGVARPQGSAPDIGAFEAIGVVGARPTVTSLVRTGVHTQPTTLVLTFSAAMSPINVQDLRNYTIVPSGPAGRPGLHARPIPIASAVYDPVARSVTLTSSRPLSVRAYFRMTASGTPPNGLKSTGGVFLDGSGSGQPGTDLVTVIHGFRSAVPTANVAIKAVPKVAALLGSRWLR